MKKSILLTLVSISFAVISHSQQLVVDNQIDCYIIIDLADDCKAHASGPYDNPANQVSYHNLSTDNINNASDIESFSIEKQSTGEIDIVEFGACASSPHTSPHTLDNTLIQCLSNDIVVEWQVNGGDFEIEIHY